MTFIHIGLIKTGSSFLQREVFSKLKNDFIYLNSTDRFFKRESLVQCVRPVLISNENLSGHPLLENTLGLSYFEQFKNSINNILANFNNPKIIIGFREPASFLNSVYKQYLHEWGTKSWEEIIENRGNNFFSNFFFSYYIDFLFDRFSPEQLFIYSHEYLKTNPEIVIGQILNFINVRGDFRPFIDYQAQANKSVSLGQEPILLKLNRMSEWLYSYLGFRLAFKVGNKGINPTKIVQDYAPKMLNRKNNVRDLRGLKAYFRKDWERSIRLIESS